MPLPVVFISRPTVPLRAYAWAGHQLSFLVKGTTGIDLETWAYIDTDVMTYTCCWLCNAATGNISAGGLQARYWCGAWQSAAAPEVLQQLVDCGSHIEQVSSKVFGAGHIIGTNVLQSSLHDWQMMQAYAMMMRQ